MSGDEVKYQDDKVNFSGEEVIFSGEEVIFSGEQVKFSGEQLICKVRRCVYFSATVHMTLFGVQDGVFSAQMSEHETRVICIVLSTSVTDIGFG